MKRGLILLVGLVVAATCVRLGVWQLDRLEQRRERNRSIARSLARPRFTLDRETARMIAADVDAFRFRRVAAEGTFDFERQVVVLARSYRGIPGVHLVTPLVIADSLAVLVERGWLPSPDGRSVDTASASEPQRVSEHGVLLLADARGVGAGGTDEWPRHVLSPDPVLMRAWYPYAILPLFMRRDAPPPGSELRAVALPERSDGPHLSYAVQWFAFATIALVGSGIFFVRQGHELREERSPIAPA